jgi:hypothetical protein
MAEQCENCRYWSQMLAQALDGGPIEAWCLSEDGPKRGRYVRANDHCPSWKTNIHGSVDEGHDYGERVRALYAAEEPDAGKSKCPEKKE